MRRSCRREAIEIRREKLPQHWVTFNALGRLGGALLQQGHPDQAEPLLLEGYHGMAESSEPIPKAAVPRITETLGWLIELYEAKGDPEQAERWREKLVKLPGE